LKYLNPLIKASRPGFYVTAMWFYLLPLGGHDVFDTAEFWLGLFYVSFPLGLFIYGWNDFVDTETDRANPRKGTYLFGAKPSDVELKWLPYGIALVQLPFFAAFFYFIGPRAIWLFVGLAGFSWLYNSRAVGFRNYPVLDLLNQSGYLVVFVLSSWLNGVPQLAWPVFVFGALFAMHSHLLGATMDIVPDRAAGRRTTASILGPIGAKFGIAAILTAEAVIVGWLVGNGIIGALLVAGAGWFVLDATVLWRNQPYSNRTMAAFLLGWNVIAIVSAPVIWWSAAFVVTI
jgi:4-hydroxybenzoate polyprenyltransferase